MAGSRRRQILDSDRGQSVLAWIVAALIRFVWWSGRWRVENIEELRRHWDSGKPIVGTFWHAHLMMMPLVWRTAMPMNMLISDHRDGRLIARIIAFLGIRTIVGSTSQGASAALKGMVRLLKQGEAVGITPDGPRGPRMHVAPGTIGAARLAGVDIVPVAISARRRKIMRSWDRFMIALPFSEGLILVGQAIAVPKDLDAEGIEAKRQELETAMIALCHEAERRMGHPPTEPGTAARQKT